MWWFQILTYLESKSINSKGFKKIELIKIGSRPRNMRFEPQYWDPESWTPRNMRNQRMNMRNQRKFNYDPPKKKKEKENLIN